MKVIAINGSPRKNGNTAALLKHALNGAASQGTETELIHLYDLNYKGCTSCFACKLKSGKSYGQCACRDDLHPLLEKISKQADVILLGSPVYFGCVSGQMRSFLERLMFPYLSYTDGYQTIFDRQLKVCFVYTMNVSRERMLASGYNQSWKPAEDTLKRIFGHFESLYSYDTYQFDDYSKYVVTVFDEKLKAQIKKEQFPIDCASAFSMGSMLCQST